MNDTGKTKTQLLDELTRLRQRIAELEERKAASDEERILLRELFDALPYPIYVKDTESRFLVANETVAQIMGTTPADLLGKTDHDFFPDDIAKAFFTDEQTIIKTGQPLLEKGEMVVDTSGGESWYLTSKVPFHDSQGNIQGIIGIGQDITARRQAEEQIQANVRFLEHLDQVNRVIQQSNDVEQLLEHVMETVFTIFDCDRAWLLYPCDPDAPSFQVPWEQARPEYPGANVLNLDVPMAPSYAHVMRDALASEHPMMETAGTEHPVAEAAATQFDVQAQMFMAIYPMVGKPWLFGMHQCSYTRVWTQEERRLFKEIGQRLGDALSTLLSLRDLRQSEARYRTVSELISDYAFAWAINPDGSQQHLWTTEDSFTRLTGYPWPKIPHTVQLFHPDDEASAQQHVAETLQGKPTEGEYRIITKSGDERWIHLCHQPIWDEQEQRVIEYYGVAQDITKRKLAEQALHIQRDLGLYLSTTSDLADAARHVLDAILQVGEIDCGRVYLRDHATGDFYLIAHQGLPPEFIASASHYAKDTPQVQIASMGKPVYRLYDQLSIEPKDAIRQREGLRVAAVIPIHFEDQFIASLSLASHTHDTISERTRHVLETIAAQIGGSIAHIQAKEALHESEERLQLALDAAQMGQWDWNIVTGEVVWSQQCLALYGLPPDTLMNYDRFLQALHPEDRERIDAALNRAVEDHSGYDEPKRAVWSDGSIHWTASRGQVYCDATGQPIRMLGVTFDISKWKEAEERLQESLAQLRAFGDALFDLGLIIDEEGRYLEILTQRNSLLYADADTLRGRLLNEILPEHQADQILAAIHMAIQTDEIQTIEYGLDVPAGNCWFEGRISPIKNPPDQKKRVVLVIRDITARKGAEKRLRLLTRAVEQSADSIMITDTEGNIEYVNPKFTALTGYSSDEVMGKNPRFLKSGWTPPEEYTCLWQTITVGREWRGEFHNKKKDGTLYWEAASITPVRDETGTITHFVAVKEDITARKEAEQATRQVRQQLQDMLDNTPAPVYAKDLNGRYIFVNREWVKRTGCDIEAIIGKTDQELFPEYYRDLWEPQEEQVLKSGETLQHEQVGKTTGQIYLTTKFLLRTAEGTPYALCNSSLDITDRKQAEQQQLELALEKDRGETFRALMSNIAHDLKTPLAIINTSLYLLAKHTDPAKRQEKVETIKGQVRILDSFIQDLLAMARLDSEPQLRLTPVDVNELVMDLEADHHDIIVQKHLTFSLDLEEALPPIPADQTDLRRALNNLVENGINYTPEGHSVAVRTYQQAREVVVEIADTGIGIGEDDLPYIFDRFYRSTAAQAITARGSGLGLGIVKLVVEMHGGTVDVESVLGEGTTFRVSLPI